MPLDIMDRDWKMQGDSWYQPDFDLEQIAQLRFVKPENNDPRYFVLNSAYLYQAQVNYRSSPRTR